MRKIIQYILDFFKSDCPKCWWKKCISFYYEDHFHTKKNVYKCNKCKREFI